MVARTLTVKESILGANNEKAESIRQFLSSTQTQMINIMSAPGSGRTSLILRTIDRFKDKYRLAVIEGCVASSTDSDQIARQNIPAIQINPEGGCHLDARMIRKALSNLDLNRTDLVLLENVGNLVCTGDFDLGAHKKVVVLSIPEGDDKPYKYPAVFLNADVVLVNKIDVLPYFDFKLDAFPEVIHGLNPAARFSAISTKTGEGMDTWFAWIEELLAQSERSF